MNGFKLAFLLSALAAFVQVPKAQAFPELVRHGYAQCTACHVSPSGGGALTSYGRQLAAEILSTWSYEGEGEFLHSPLGAKLAEKGFIFGGDVRSVQTRKQDRVANSGRLFLMQANIEVGYQYGRFTALASIGEIENPMSGVFRGNFNSTKFYGMAQITDQWAVRAGRFEPAYGLNVADHVMVIKSGLGLGQGRQWDTLETNYFTEKWSLIGSAATTLSKTPKAQEEDLYTANASYFLLDKYRLGASLRRGERNTFNRATYGLNAILGFTHELYSLLEFDVKEEPGRKGNYALSQLAYEVYKGVVPYVQYQYMKSDLSTRNTESQYYGAGIHLFPRPHIEVSGIWNRVWTGTNQWTDDAYLLAHYYF